MRSPTADRWGNAKVRGFEHLLDGRDRLASDHPRGRDDLARAVQLFVSDHAHDPNLDPTAIAAAFHLSRRSLYALLEPLGLSPGELIRRERIARAARLLQTDDVSVETVAYRSGFTDPRTFSRAFRSVHGVTPGAYRRRFRTAIGLTTVN